MSTQIHGRYHGESGALFKLYLKTAFLTLITLGIYRFWAKTRMRKYIWSATTGDQDSFEYTGTGLEKFLGFLIAIVILAIYLGIVQMVLFFFGIFLFDEPTTQAEALAQIGGVYITLFAVAPLMLFAQYRSRRYQMSRTRWRGLRFGMDSEAGGYVWRGLGHILLTILTLGLMYPRQNFWLEKYMADRTWYGDAKLEQNGKWTKLYPGMKHLIIGIVVLLGGVAVAAIMQAEGLGAIAGFVGYIWVMIGFVYYRVYSFNYLTQNKLLDEKIGFEANARTGQIVGIYIVGGLVIGVVGAIFGALIFGVMSTVINFSAAAAQSADNLAGLTSVGIVVAVLYIIFLMVLGGIAMVLIVQKVLKHYVESVTVTAAQHLDTIRQRAADKGADAEGFADALDIGGAI